MKYYMLMLPLVLVAVIALTLGINAQGAWGDDKDNDDEKKNVIEFAETKIFFEFNSTDLDLGIQLFFDADGWKNVEVKGPDGKIFEVKNGKGLKKIGSTEVFTESEEPELDEANLEQEMADFLAMFAEGEYVFKGKTIDGDKLEGTALLTYDLPDPVMFSEDVADEFPEIKWTPAATGPEIVRYQVVAEMVIEDDAGQEQVFVHSVDFPASITEMTVSDEFADLAEAFEASGELLELKVELIAEEASGNKTITEEFIFELDQ